MANQSTAIPDRHASPRVRVLLARDGGWDVETTAGDGSVSIVHCRTWHKVERACMDAAGTTAPPLVALAATAALVLLCWALPGAARAQEPPPAAILSEPRVLAAGIDLVTGTIGQAGDRERSGLYPEFGNMPTGSGWVSAGPGYRRWLADDRIVIDASAAVSWRLYKMAQARFELTPLRRGSLALGAQVRWQDLTQVTYFGEGVSPEDQRSEYRFQSSNVVGYATVRPRRWLAVDGQIGWLQPDLDTPAGTFRRGNPSTQTMFPADPAFARPDQPAFVHGELAVTADTRDHRGHPTRGGVYRTAWSRYSDRDTGAFAFDRYEAEAAHFVPVAGARVVFAVHGWLAASATGDGHLIPFYMLPSLGGANTLRGFTDYRFHDRNSLVVNAETRAALFPHVDVAVFLDAGTVAARLADLNLGERSYGAGIRLHTGRATLARFDVGHGAEGWRLLLRMNDPLRLSRLARRTAAAPVVP